MPRPYAVLDVFTDTALAGNPLAVVLDAAGIDDERMQAIAAEFNLSETVFVFPPDNRVHSARLRIFTPRRELPFAGHPTVGTAVLLGIGKVAEGAPGNDVMLMLEELVGAVRCGVSVKDQYRGHAIFDLPKLPEPVEKRYSREAVAAALGLEPAEIGFENHVPTAFDAGVPYNFVPVRDLAAIGQASPIHERWEQAFGSGHHPNAYLYCRETEGSGRHFHARMFAPLLGIAEDPATGSAAAAFAGVIRRFDEPPSGSHRFIIEQGFEMRRPSLMALEVDIEKGAIAAARIGGDAVIIARGTLEA
jgi:trans-2,3-dihydro-3-hydroxyanthranilate isomerase